MTNTIWMQILCTILPLAVTWGSITARLKILEKKMEEHNNFMVRLAKVEESTKSAHHRMDELHDEVMNRET